MNIKYKKIKRKKRKNINKFSFNNQNNIITTNTNIQNNTINELSIDDNINNIIQPIDNIDNIEIVNKTIVDQVDQVEQTKIIIENKFIDELLIKECKICLSETNPDDLISPCLCKGSLKYVHLSCLNSFHEKTDRYKDKCSICGFIYMLENIQDDDTILNTMSIYSVIYLNNVLCVLSCIEHNLLSFILLSIFKSTIYYIVHTRKMYLYKVFPKTNTELVYKYNYSYSTHLGNHLVSSMMFLPIYKFIKYIFFINNDFYFITPYIFFSIIHLKNLFFIIKKNTKITKITNIEIKNNF